MFNSRGYQVFLIALILAATGSSRADNVLVATANEQPFAIVEVFGNVCSPDYGNSALVVDYAAEKAQKQKQQILPLVFNISGESNCPDSNGFETFNARFEEYQLRWSLNSLNSPVFITNGRQTSVTTLPQRVRNSINLALKTRPQRTISLGVKIKKQAATIFYDMDFYEPAVQIGIALVEKARSYTFADGRTGVLRNIVRNFHLYRLDKSGKGAVLIRVPAGLRADDIQVVVFAQKTDTGQIIAANVCRTTPANQ